MQQTIDLFGWRTACLAVAALIAFAIIPMNLLFQRRRPEDLGLKPDGDRDALLELEPGETAPRIQPDTVVDPAWANTDWTASRAVRTARFWWLFAGYFCALFVWYALQVHQTKYLIETGFGATQAAAALGLVAFFAIGGQIAIGAWSDRAGREVAWSIAMLGFAASSLLMLWLDRTPSFFALYAMVVTQGFFGNAIAALFGAIPAEIFAGRRFSSIFALISLGANLGAATGVWLLGAIYDSFGAYQIGFSICAAASLVSIACIWAAAPRKVRLVAGQAKRRAGTAAEVP